MLMVLLINPILAQDTQEEDKTLSPYFMVVGGQKGVDQLPLLSTSADVNIAGERRCNDYSSL